MKSVTKEVQIKCWGDSKEKENSHLWRNRNHIHNMGPISSISILCRGKAFKVTFRSSFLIVPFLRTFILSLPQSLLSWSGSGGTCVTLKGIFIFTAIKNYTSLKARLCRNFPSVAHPRPFLCCF